MAWVPILFPSPRSKLFFFCLVLLGWLVTAAQPKFQHPRHNYFLCSLPITLNIVLNLESAYSKILHFLITCTILLSLLKTILALFDNLNANAQIVDHFKKFSKK
jgi:hypothetical protein